MRISTSVSRHRVLQRLVVCGLLGFCSVLDAKEDEMPDAAFLEYLGSWDESDEDWLLVRDREKVREKMEKDERSHPVPQGEESTEAEHERK